MAARPFFYIGQTNDSYIPAYSAASARVCLRKLQIPPGSRQHSPVLITPKQSLFSIICPGAMAPEISFSKWYN
jgi:hypothetical protein